MSSADQPPSLRPESTPATGKSLRLSPVPVERFDEYVVVARLGHGGMAEVILGLSQGLSGFRKLVAIKRLHAHCEESPEQVQMFLHEATLAALLSHPNVVQTHKVGVASGRHFIAMEYLEGQPLHRALPRLRGAGKGLDPVLAAVIASEALAGLAHVHGGVGYDGTPLGLVHRDVSPQNLFITYDGQVKLLDFGIAKAAALSGQTRHGLIKGKLGYIAPEQARGQVDRRADLWSVGVVLWEALAGTRLFRGDDEVALLRSVLSMEIPPLHTLDPSIPEPLAQIVARALERDRARRYVSAEEMKAELDAWLIAAGAEASGTPLPGGGARATLAGAMQARFADAITERRAAVLECLAAVEQEQRWQTLTNSAFDAARASAAPEEPRPARSRRSRWVALSGAVLLIASTVLALEASTGSGPGSEPAARRAVVAAPAAAELHEAEAASSPALSPAPHAPAAPAVAPRSASAPAAAPVSLGDSVPETAGGASIRRRPTRAVQPDAPEESSASKVSVPAQLPVVEAPAAPEPAKRPGAREASERTSAPAVRSAQSDAAREPLPLGRLRLDASPYAVVSLDGRRLGITPIDVELPAQVHVLTLRNPERGIDTTYRVQVVAGESVSRRLELD